MPTLGTRARTGLLGVLYVGAGVLLGASLGDAQSDPTELRDLALKKTNSLKTVAVPDQPNLNQFVRDRQALKILGKALFWDQQVGSDGQACASCHFHAGADNRSKNQLDPGLRNQTPGANPFAFNDATGFGPTQNAFGPNYQLTASDFPLRKLTDVNNQNSTVISDTNDVASSQGVFNAAFNAIGIPGDGFFPFDHGSFSTTGFGSIFNVGGALVRNVEPRNTPTTINAVFNHRNFWDSRARNEFNGVNPIGNLDPTAVIVKAVGSSPAFVQISITNASPASQADGPPLSDLEMSFAGRRFPEVGRKMLHPSLVALGQQLVARDDSLLGPSSNQNVTASARGISLRYADLIQQAFSPAWWDAPGWVVDLASGQPVLVRSTVTGPNRFTVMEFNFSVYFGLAVNEYEKTLVADDTRFDRFLEGALTALTDQEQRGLRIFLTGGKCINCHGGPELTNASITRVQKFELLERMIMGNDQVAVYDNGHYNIAVRPTLEDLGIGATIGPLNLPLSNSRFFQNCVRDSVATGLDARSANAQCKAPKILARPAEAADLLAKAAALLGPNNATRKAAEALIADANALLAAVPPDPVQASCKLAKNPALPCPVKADGTQVDGAADLLEAVRKPPAGIAALVAAARSLLPDPVAPGTADKLVGPPLQPNERVAVDGAHKAPGLRNVELTAPYFHNGHAATLAQVVEFYNRGGNFAAANQQDFDIDIQPLFLTDADKADLVAFLTSLTDERVRFDRAPFDHPSLTIPNGGSTVTANVPGCAICMDDQIELLAVGTGGNRLPLGTARTPLANFLQPLR
jgi:cytochrome c peroxidase